LEHYSSKAGTGKKSTPCEINENMNQTVLFAAWLSAKAISLFQMLLPVLVLVVLTVLVLAAVHSGAFFLKLP
jgi:hypothetical protein